MSDGSDNGQDVMQSDVAELFIRADASEARQSALEARQTRIERGLGDQQVQLQQQAKLLVAQNEKLGSLGDKIDRLIEAVLALSPKAGNGHG